MEKAVDFPDCRWATFYRVAFLCRVLLSGAFLDTSTIWKAKGLFSRGLGIGNREYRTQRGGFYTARTVQFGSVSV